MNLNRKAKFRWVDDYYHSHWSLTMFEDEPEYDKYDDIEMSAEFVQEWAKAHKAVEALEDLLREAERIKFPVEMAVCSVCGEQDRPEFMTEIGLGSDVYECDKCWYTTGGEPLKEEENERQL
jgi:hypothetical protein